MGWLVKSEWVEIVDRIAFVSLFREECMISLVCSYVFTNYLFSIEDSLPIFKLILEPPMLYPHKELLIGTLQGFCVLLRCISIRWWRQVMEVKILERLHLHFIPFALCFRVPLPVEREFSGSMLVKVAILKIASFLWWVLFVFSFLYWRIIMFLWTLQLILSQ